MRARLGEAAEMMLRVPKHPFGHGGWPHILDLIGRA